MTNLTNSSLVRVPFRHVSLREFLVLVSRATGIPEEELWVDEFLSTAKTALDKPASRMPDADGMRSRERHDTMPLRFASLITGLLEGPPLSDYEDIVAQAAGDELLRRGNARWTGDPTKTRILFKQWARYPEQINQRLLRRGVGPRGALRAPEQEETLFEASKTITIGVYLAAPLRALRAAGESGIVKETHDACEQELHRLTRRTAGRMRFVLLYPSYDDSDPEGDDTWEWDQALLDNSTAVLAAADLGKYPISFGVACEVARFSRLPGCTVYLRAPDEATRSSYVSGLSREVAMPKVPCPTRQDLPRCLVDSIVPRLPLILDAVRRRDDALVLATPAHHRLKRKWNQMTRVQRDEARDAADLTPSHLSRVLESVEAFAALPQHATERLAALMGDETGRAGGIRDPVDFDEIISLASRLNWSAKQISGVTGAARAQARALGAAWFRPDVRYEYYVKLYRDLYGR